MAFTSTTAKQKFLASEEASWAKGQLEKMVNDEHYNTPQRPFYVHADSDEISFVEQHMQYLSEHSQIKVDEYISNLRLKSKKWASDK